MKWCSILPLLFARGFSFETCLSHPCGMDHTCSQSMNKVTCTDCPFGKYQGETTSPTQHTCKDCPTGFVSHGDGLCGFQLPTCLIGFGFVNHACQHCANGQYSDEINYEPCKKCPDGYRTTDTLDGCTLLNCPNNEIIVKNVCRLCEQGKQISEENGYKTCVTCSTGKYGIDVGKGCGDCVAGKYQDQTGQLKCKECPAGYVAFNSGSACRLLVCNKGEKKVQDYCVDCDTGYYTDQYTQNVCKECPEGWGTPGKGEPECYCVPGRYGSGGKCKYCEAGKYTDEFGLERFGYVMCKNCDIGKYSHRGKPSCTKCKVGQYQTEKGQPNCIGCVDGKYQNITQNSHKEDTCTDCPIGTFNRRQSATTCKLCPTGQYNNITGQSECKKCDVGKYNDDTGNDDCKICPHGKYQDEHGKDTCKSCEEGKYKDQTGTTMCKECDIGKYLDEVGGIQCKDCDAGKSTTGTGKTTETSCKACCKACIQGKYFFQGSECIYCDIGKYIWTSGESECKMCYPGYYQDLMGKVSCKGCTAGKYQNEYGKATCKDCAAGKYLDKNLQKDSGACIDCPEGKYSSATGLTSDASCTKCPKGKHSSQRGASSEASCISCIKGKYSTLDGATSSDQCKWCSEGKFSNILGASSNTCQYCPAGYYSYGASECTKCPIGQFQDLNGKSSCKVCEGQVKENAQEGATTSDVCTGCPPGFYLEKLDASERCFDCPSGRYSDGGSVRLRNETGYPCKACEEGKVERTKYDEQGNMLARDGTNCEGCTYNSYIDSSGTCASCSDAQIGLNKCECPTDYPYFNGRYCANNITCNNGEFYSCEKITKYDINGNILGFVEECTCKSCPEGKWTNGGVIRECSSLTYCLLKQYNSCTGDTDCTCEWCPDKMWAGSMRTTCIDECDTQIIILNEPGPPSCTCGKNQIVVDAIPSKHGFGGGKTCDECENAWSNGGTVTSCSTCPENYGYNGTGCFRCGEERWSAGGNDECKYICRNGYTFKNRKCIQCPQGQTSHGKVCYNERSQFLQVSFLRPIDCDINTYHDGDGNCVACPDGKFSPGGDVLQCFSNCSQNEFNDGIGNCYACPEGEISLGGSATFCLKHCDVGMKNDEGECVDCEVGKWSDGGYIEVCSNLNCEGVDLQDIQIFKERKCT